MAKKITSHLVTLCICVAIPKVKPLVKTLIVSKRKLVPTIIYSLDRNMLFGRLGKTKQIVNTNLNFEMNC